MQAARVHGAAGPLHPAPARDVTPIPATFGLLENPTTATYDNGTVVLGGSPLRVLRISERARDLVARWRDGAPVGSGRARGLFARRLVSAGIFRPCPPSERAEFGPDDVSVIVPVRDRPDHLLRLLETLDPALERIVVDDGSTDAGASKEIARQVGARFIGLETNRGPSGARNAGLAIAHTPLVAFVDSDCQPSPGWLEPLLPHFDDPLVAAVAPRIVGLAQSPSGSSGAMERYLSARSSLDLGPDDASVRRGGPVSYVPSAALVVRAGVCATSELFDSTLRGGEDVDLVWRLADAGWEVRYVASSLVRHQGPSSFVAHLERRAFYGATAGPLALRHPGSMAPMSASAWSVAAWCLAAARRPGAALVVQGVSIALLAQRLRGLVRQPVVIATRIAGGGTARSAGPALAGLARTWAPALVVALAFRRTRRPAALALLAPALRDWGLQRDRLGELDPVRYVAFHIADNLAYGIGVWAGCARTGVVEPLVPSVAWRSRVWSERTLRRNLSPGNRSGTGGSAEDA